MLKQVSNNEQEEENNISNDKIVLTHGITNKRLLLIRLVVYINNFFVGLLIVWIFWAMKWWYKTKEISIFLKIWSALLQMWTNMTQIYLVPWLHLTLWGFSVNQHRNLWFNRLLSCHTIVLHSQILSLFWGHKIPLSIINNNCIITSYHAHICFFNLWS